jgi:hypothetical protein
MDIVDIVMGYLGFRALRSLIVAHLTKKKGRGFQIYPQTLFYLRISSVGI